MIELCKKLKPEDGSTLYTAYEKQLRKAVTELRDLYTDRGEEF